MMAKVVDNLILQGLSGSLGNMVFRQMADGSVRVCKRPDFSKRKCSQAQKAQQKRFKSAVNYAREASKNQPIYAELARGTSKNAYNLALSDWCKSPVIESIEKRKGVVRLAARDNVLVAKVLVKIVDAEGNILEEGQANQVAPATFPERWEYATDVQGTVEATAWDLAGNQAHARLQP